VQLLKKGWLVQHTLMALQQLQLEHLASSRIFLLLPDLAWLGSASRQPAAGAAALHLQGWVQHRGMQRVLLRHWVLQRLLADPAAAGGAVVDTVVITAAGGSAGAAAAAAYDAVAAGQAQASQDCCLQESYYTVLQVLPLHYVGYQLQQPSLLQTQAPAVSRVVLLSRC
jgi:hypothetical protein